jgi:hypothetical protein
MSRAIVIDPMNPMLVWTLFVLTMVLHAVTFFFLQGVSNYFKTYIEISPVGGNDNMTIQKKTESGVVVNNNPTQMRTAGCINVFNRESVQHSCTDSKSRVYYQPLHETLDVSVFR